MIELDLGLIADNAHIDQSGKFYILGEFRYIFAQKLPVRYSQLAVVARWFADLVEVRKRKNVIEVEIVDEDGNAIMQKTPKLPLNFGPVGPAKRGKAYSQLVVSLDGIVFKKYGSYAIHFFINDSHSGHVSLYVTQRTSKKK